MIIRLSSEDIVKYWDQIRYGLQQIVKAQESVIDEPNMMAFTNTMLKNLLLDKAQAWFIMTEDRRPKMLVVTTINKTIGGQMFVQIDFVYGYLASTEQEKKELLVKEIGSFGLNVGAIFGLTYSPNPLAWRAALQAGMTEKARIFTIDFQKEAHNG